MCVECEWSPAFSGKWRRCLPAIIGVRVVSESAAVGVGVCARPTTKFFRLWASIPWPFFSPAPALPMEPALSFGGPHRLCLLGNHPEVHCAVQILDRERASFFQMHAWSLPSPPPTHRILFIYMPVCLLPVKACLFMGSMAIEFASLGLF